MQPLQINHSNPCSHVHAVKLRDAGLISLSFISSCLDSFIKLEKIKFSFEGFHSQILETIWNLFLAHMRKNIQRLTSNFNI